MPARQNISHKIETYQDDRFRYQNKPVRPKLNKPVRPKQNKPARPEVSKGEHLIGAGLEIMEEVDALRESLR